MGKDVLDIMVTLKTESHNRCISIIKGNHLFMNCYVRYNNKQRHQIVLRHILSPRYAYSLWIKNN